MKHKLFFLFLVKRLNEAIGATFKIQRNKDGNEGVLQILTLFNSLSEKRKSGRLAFYINITIIIVYTPPKNLSV